MMPTTLNFRALVPMLGVMNASAQVTAAPIRGPKLDNRRVLAAVVDLAIVSAGAALILFAGDSLTGERQGALTAVILGWALYYFFALESGDGQTVGKRLMKLRVVRANGAPAGMREVAVRTALRVVDNYLIGMIVMLATGERRQRIGDLAAGTVVVDASAPAVAAPQPEPVVEAEEPQPAEAPAEEPAVEDAVLTQTITLPSRPTPPATLSDLTEPEPIVEEPVLDAEPVIEEPVAEEPAAEVAEEPLPDVTSPTIEGLAHDVAAARESAGEEPAEEPEAFLAEEPVVEVEPEPVVAEEPAVEVEPEPVVAEEPAVEVEPVKDEPVEDEPVEDDGPVTVRSVETVSAMDLIMGAAEEDASDDRSESAHDLPDSA
jgi:uncharacterized RDD family membrane protein YckC